MFPQPRKAPSIFPATSHFFLHSPTLPAISPLAPHDLSKSMGWGEKETGGKEVERVGTGRKVELLIQVFFFAFL